jgi:hypothetical protein
MCRFQKSILYREREFIPQRKVGYKGKKKGLTGSRVRAMRSLKHGLDGAFQETLLGPSRVPRRLPGGVGVPVLRIAGK